ncbi:hypothetical protein C8J57DRAFT_1549978 [Mycena rebaudengoi]|nr:hypothetical protein C8J57DRAFT_1549978 [Mycena rebaudengoi]
MAESGKPNPFAAFAHLSLKGLEDTLGVFYIGYTLAVVGYGFTFFQTYYYFIRYPKDHWSVKAAVTVLCLLDTAMSTLSSHTLYYYLVTLFALPVTPDDATSSFCVEILLSGLAIFVVQSFYAFRIWKLSKNAFIAIAIAMISAGAASLSIASAVLMMRNTPFANFAQAYMKTTIGSGQGLRLLSGLLITGFHAIYAYQAPRKEGPSLWEPVVNFLTSGLAAVIVQAVCLITFVAMPKKYTWIIPHLLSSRVFINGLLLSLNARAISHGRGLYAEETQNSSRGGATTPGTRLGTHMTASKGGRGETFSEIRYATPVQRTLNIEVSRTIASDANTVLGGKGHLSNLSEHSLNDKVDVHAF